MSTRGRWAFLCLLLVVLFTGVAGVARAAYVPPPIAGHVTDAAGKLSASEIATLNQKLADYRTCSSNHIAVFLPASLEGAPVEDVAYVAFNTWKIGEAKKDNGVLLVIATAERKIRIETGKGVGGQLTDLESAEILREVVGPNLKAGRVFAAIDLATTRIGKALGGCAMQAPTSKPLESGEGVHPVLGIILSIVVAACAFISLRANGVRWAFSLVLAPLLGVFLGWWTSGLAVSPMMDRFFPFLFGSVFVTIGSLVRYGIKHAKPGSGGSGGSSWSASSSWESGGGGSDYSSSSGSDYSGGGGSSGGGGASDSY